MKACPYCGLPLSEDDAFCPGCGAENTPESARTELNNPPAAEGTEAAEAAPAAEPAPEAAPVEEAAPAEEEAPVEEVASAEKEALVEEEAPAEEAPAEEATVEEAAPVEEEAPAEKKPSLWQRLRRMREEKRPAFLFDREVRGRLLRRIGCAITALGLLALLAAALVLFFMNKQQIDARSGSDEDFVTLPAKPGIINYFTPPDPEKMLTDGEIRFMSNELIAVSAQGVSYTDMERFFGERNIRIIGYVELTDTYQLRLPEEHGLIGLSQIAEKLEAEPQVDCAVVNVLWENACYTVPEDPWDGSADWESTDPEAANWGLQAIRAPESWEQFEPGALRVGLIDSAFDPAHEDLRYALLHGNEGYLRTRDAQRTEFWQHGTAVAAVTGAVRDNGLGLSGAAENCQIYACGSSQTVGQMDALSALAELAAQDVPVIQYSLGWQEELLASLLGGDAKVRSLYCDDPARAAGLGLERMLQKGYDFLLVLPAGNGLQGQGTDAGCSSVFAAVSREPVRSRILVVGAAGLDEEGGFYQAPFSGTGERVDLLAPGVEIYTALPGGAYGRRSGSSLAAAHATAVCAGAWALNPALSGAELRDLVVKSADSRVSGTSVGMLDMYAALEAAVKSAGSVPALEEKEQALDAYAQLLRRGVQLQGRSAGVSLPARYYALLDMDGDGVQELLLYALDETGLSASFAIYGFRDGTATELGNAWESCRFASWSNVSLTLEICGGNCLYAAAEKDSAGYGERFWLSFDGESLSCAEEDLRPTGGERIKLIEESVVTEAAIRIGSAEDTLLKR